MKENKKGIPQAPAGLEVTDLFSQHAQFPGIMVEEDGKVIVHWQDYCECQDSLLVAEIVGNQIEAPKKISGEGQVLYPVSLSFGEAQWFGWSEYDRGLWSIKVRSKIDGKWNDIEVLETGDALLYPSLFVWKDQPHLIWTRQAREKSEAVLCSLGGKDTNKEVVSISEMSFRAHACCGGDGNLYIAYEAYREGSYRLYARVKTHSGWTDEVCVHTSDAWASSPKIIGFDNGATVCWYSYGYDAEYQVMSADISCKDSVITVQQPLVVTQGIGWYLDLDAYSNAEGLQVLAYTWSKNAIMVRYRYQGDSWSSPTCMSFNDTHCAIHPKLFVDNDDNIYLAWQFAHRNGHYERNAQIIVTMFTTQDIDARDDSSMEVPDPFGVPIAANKTKMFESHEKEVQNAWLKRNGYHGMKLLFGDIHGQSNISDGMGFIDQYFHRARTCANLDFSALTDHDCYPDWMSQSEWELVRTTTRLMNRDDELTCLLAYEWTPNEYRYDFGHKNIYYKDDEGDVFRSGESSGMTPPQLYESIKRYAGFCVPHHPAADWTLASAATDWDFYDPQVQRLAEIFSRHAPYENYEGRSKFTKNIKKFPHRSVQDGLAKGYRFGIIAGSDSHQMEHGIEGGIVAVYTSSHTRAGIWDSLYNRMCYGTTGARILLSLKVNGVPMGGETRYLRNEPISIDVSVAGTNPLDVILLRNNSEIVLWHSNDGFLDTNYKDLPLEKTVYYYIRVEQTDEHMAWSSPIWVDIV